MKNSRNSRKPAKDQSRGTTWAEQTRTQCNTLTPAQREKMLERALKIAYGTEPEPAGARRR